MKPADFARVQGEWLPDPYLEAWRAYDEKGEAEAHRTASYGRRESPPIEDSREVISAGELRVGQRVLYGTGKRTYEATITKVGRSKVTIRYHLKTTGAERTKLVYAAWVRPL